MNVDQIRKLQKNIASSKLKKKNSETFGLGYTKNTVYAQASAEFVKKKKKVPRKKSGVSLQQVPWKAIGAFCLIVFGSILCYSKFYDNRQVGPKKQNEVFIGGKIAEITSEKLKSKSRVTVLFTFNMSNQYYGPRAEAIIDSLKTHGHLVSEFWAVEKGLYDDEENDYTDCLDAALKSSKSCDALLVVGIGGVTHANMSEKIKNFLEGGGKIVLAGKCERKSVFTKLADAGWLTIVAPKIGWLRKKRVSGVNPNGPEEFFNHNYIVIAGTKKS